MYVQCLIQNIYIVLFLFLCFSHRFVLEFFFLFIQKNRFIHFISLYFSILCPKFIMNKTYHTRNSSKTLVGKSKSSSKCVVTDISDPSNRRLLRSNSTLSQTYASVTKSPPSPRYSLDLMKDFPASNTRSRTVSVNSSSKSNSKLLSLRKKTCAMKKTAHCKNASTKSSTLESVLEKINKKKGSSVITKIPVVSSEKKSKKSKPKTGSSVTSPMVSDVSSEKKPKTLNLLA